MKRRGFTYMELMVVWAIISILAAILFPVFARARAKAQQNNCLHNLYSIGLALHVYAQDNYGHFPAVNNDFTPLLGRALPDAGVLVCPSAGNSLGPPAGVIPPAPPPGKTDYVYWGGACDDDRPTFAIAGDEQEALHNQGANYLYVDGHVKWGAMTNCVPVGAGPYTELIEYGFAQLQQCRELKPGYKPYGNRGEEAVNWPGGVPQGKQPSAPRPGGPPGAPGAPGAPGRPGAGAPGGAPGAAPPPPGVGGRPIYPAGSGKKAAGGD